MDDGDGGASIEQGRHGKRGAVFAKRVKRGGEAVSLLALCITAVKKVLGWLLARTFLIYLSISGQVQPSFPSAPKAAKAGWKEDDRIGAKSRRRIYQTQTEQSAITNMPTDQHDRAE